MPERTVPTFQILGSQGAEEMDVAIRDMLPGLFGSRTKRRSLPVAEARAVLRQEEEARLVDQDQVAREAVERAESAGIVFLDEIDKIAGRESVHGPDVSREGVQRDLLPIVEGTTVSTKYGPVRTDHVLFIAAGAFHVSKPTDLIPELQGRFPIRVELASLGEEDLLRILTEPQNALVRQYRDLLGTEGVSLSFTDDAVAEMARFAARVNDTTENIGARRLATILETRPRRGLLRGGRHLPLRGHRRRGLRAAPPRAARQEPGPLPVHPVMRQRPALLLAALAALAPACGHRGDPLPPRRRTPPAPQEFRLAQRGDALEVRAIAPAASVDGVAYETLTVEFLYAEGQQDLEKAGRRHTVPAVPGSRVVETLPLPRPGTTVRAAARAVAGGRRGSGR